MNLLISIGAAVLSLMAPDGAKVIHDVAYADGPRGKMDVYEPSHAVSGAPLVVFVYGGSWDSGSKSIYRFVGKTMASRGFVTVIPDYRVYPEVRYPDFLRDNAKAVAFAKAHAADWGADPARIVLAGHSAGAYNVAMLALDRRWLGEVGLDPRRDIRGLVGLAGPYDFLPLRSAELKIIFGPPETRPDTQPINHVDGSAPPMLLFAGTKDSTVDPGNSTRLAAAITAKGGIATARLVPGKTHIGMVEAILPAHGNNQDVLGEVSNFIQSITAPQPVRNAA